MPTTVASCTRVNGKRHGLVMAGRGQARLNTKFQADTSPRRSTQAVQKMVSMYYGVGELTQ